MSDPMPPTNDYRFFAAELGKLRAEVTDLQNATGSQMNQSVSKIAATIAAMPVGAAGSASRTGFSLTAGWVTYATVSVPVPAGKTKATVMALGSGTALDATSGGVTSIEGRVVISGGSGVAVPSTKDAGASFVNNVVTAMHTREISGATGSITAQLQMNPLNPAAFPASAQNVAQISLYVSFSA